MASAFKAIVPPKNFGVVLMENPDFLTIQIEPGDLEKLSEEEIPQAVQYINDVKRTLESFGAIVLVVREALEK